LALLAEFFQQAAPPKGEVVILVSGMKSRDDTFDTAKLIAMLHEEMQATSLRDAVQTVSQISGQSRKIIYSLAIDLDREN
jgi:16S rRNA C1402 (ribose-2'-O) methylase RsmI